MGRIRAAEPGEPVDAFPTDGAPMTQRTRAWDEHLPATDFKVRMEANKLVANTKRWVSNP